MPADAAPRRANEVIQNDPGKDEAGVGAAAGAAQLAKRERWASRWTFIIASVSSAIGLGNVWRFPYLMYKHGGGAFLIPYAVFLLATGLPLLQTELALGRLFQKGDIEAFGAINKRCRGVGAISVVGGFGIVTYYSVIVSWAVYFFGASFQWPLPWAMEECAADAVCSADPDRALPIATSNSYFTDTLLNESQDSLNSGVARVISGPLLGCLMFTWVCGYFCIWKGVKSVGVAVKLTVILPWLFLTFLIIYNSTLEGSKEGVKAYIGEWDLSILKDGAAWSDAAGQIFFTLSATVGVMSAYASYAPATTNVWADNNYICYINCFTSLMAGFAVFSMLGNMAHRQRGIAADNPDLRVNICEQYVQDADVDFACPALCDMCAAPDWMDLSESECCGEFGTANVAEEGIMLAFSVYPSTLQFIPKGTANSLSAIWFALLWLLGIDSMFAHIEAVTTVITDTPRFRHLRREFVSAITSILGFVGAIAFVSDIGRPLLDAFDHYIINYGLFFTGAVEAFTVSWIWGWKETRTKCGRASAILLTWGFLVASVVGTGTAGCLHYATAPGANVAAGFGIGLCVFAIAIVLAFVCRDNQAQPLKVWLDVWVFAGTRNLRNTFQIGPTARDRLFHIITFDVPIKYICPPTLLGLFVNQAIVDATSYESGYKNYPAWLQAVAGIVVLGIMFAALVGFAIYPDFWDVMGKDEEAGKQVAIYDPVQMDEANDVEAAEQPALRPMFAMPEDDDWGA